MGGLTVTVVPVADGQYAVVLVDPTTAKLKGAQGRDCDPHGYTEAELRPILSDCYGLPPEEIEARIAVAKG
jgi:hypothetical protein